MKALVMISVVALALFAFACASEPAPPPASVHGGLVTRLANESDAATGAATASDAGADAP